MIKILLPFLSLLCCTIISATPIVRFTSTTISVNQTAGSVDIPIIMTGESNGNGYDTYFYCNTQRGTANSGIEYKGINDQIHYFPNYDGISGNSTISVPIYFTASPVDKFFTVVLSDYNASVGTPSSITVTILGYEPPPAIQILTTSAKAGGVTLRGIVTGSSDLDIRKIEISLAGKSPRVRGKSVWSSEIFIRKKGKYLVTARVYFKNGKTLTTNRTLRIK